MMGNFRMKSITTQKPLRIILFTFKPAVKVQGEVRQTQRDKERNFQT